VFTVKHKTDGSVEQYKANSLQKVLHKPIGLTMRNNLLNYSSTFYVQTKESFVWPKTIFKSMVQAVSWAMQRLVTSQVKLIKNFLLNIPLKEREQL
jgi:hypothetical protein